MVVSKDGYAIGTLDSLLKGLWFEPHHQQYLFIQRSFLWMGLLCSGRDILTQPPTSAIHCSLHKSVVITGWLLDMKSSCYVS